MSVKSNTVENFVKLSLEQDSRGGKISGISFQNSRQCGNEVCYDGGIGEGNFQLNERLISGSGPFQFVVYLQQVRHRGEYLKVVPAEVAVAGSESEEGLNIVDGGRYVPS